MTLAGITDTLGKIFSAIIQTEKNQESLRLEKKQIVQLSGLEITLGI